MPSSKNASNTSASPKQTTIGAVATPPGRGGIGIVRVSGPRAYALATEITKKHLKVREATFCAFYDQHQQVIDEGLAIYFQAPHSFTGEDIVEFQGHGSPVALDLLLKRLFSLGATPANPGEFSERAFLNDKIDLVQAEAIADLINTSSERAYRLAIKNLKGVFSARISTFQEKLTTLRVYVEAAIDFPEEEIDFLGDGKILNNLSECINELNLLLKNAQQGAVIREGLTIVLAGYPNSGKSTLLNCLSGKESAIVTDIPGTTRDVMREQILIHGMPIHIIDTAGLRESDDPIEQEGMRRAWQEIEGADHVLLLTDIEHSDRLEEIKASIAEKLKERKASYTTVINKIDKTPQTFKNTENVFYISAKEEMGIDDLREHLSHIAGLESSSEENLFMARRRHLEALENALEHLEMGRSQLIYHKAGELLAEDLRQAQKYLSQITGEFSSDDLLGKIFSSFCIGK